MQLLIANMLLDWAASPRVHRGRRARGAARHGIIRAPRRRRGDVTAGDPPPDAKGWKVGIAPVEDARLRDGQAKPITYLLLKNAAVSTAGDANQFVEIGGVRYSHIVDPKTGLGLVGRRGVTVIARKESGPTRSTPPRASSAPKRIEIDRVAKAARLVRPRNRRRHRQQAVIALTKYLWRE